MKVKEIKELIENSPNSNQRIIIEDDWAVYSDSFNYDSNMCDEDTVRYIYIDSDGSLHIHLAFDV